MPYKNIGTRLQVMNKKAKKTAGGLRKKDLKWKNGKIISKKASKSAKKTKNFLKKNILEVLNLFLMEHNKN